MRAFARLQWTIESRAADTSKNVHILQYITLFATGKFTESSQTPLLYGKKKSLSELHVFVSAVRCSCQHSKVCCICARLISQLKFISALFIYYNLYLSALQKVYFLQFFIYTTSRHDFVISLVDVFSQSRPASLSTSANTCKQVQTTFSAIFITAWTFNKMRRIFSFIRSFLYHESDPFMSAFPTLRKATISFVMSAFPPGQLCPPWTGLIKFEI